MNLRRLVILSILFTLLGEGLTVALRFGTGVSAVEFNETAPLLLQIHHMFWSIPLLAAAYFARRYERTAVILAALGVACIGSDLMHHFVVLPITVGNTGWHWP